MLVLGQARTAPDSPKAFLGDFLLRRYGSRRGTVAAVTCIMLLPSVVGRLGV